MKVFLRLNRGEFYYGGCEYWVQTAEDAFDLETIERATEVGLKENLEFMEIVVSFGDPTCDLLLPLNRRRARRADTAPATVPPTPHRMSSLIAARDAQPASL